MNVKDYTLLSLIIAGIFICGALSLIVSVMIVDVPQLGTDLSSWKGFIAIGDAAFFMLHTWFVWNFFTGKRWVD